MGMIRGIGLAVLVAYGLAAAPALGAPRGITMSDDFHIYFGFLGRDPARLGLCFTDRQLRNFVSDRGYSDVRLAGEFDRGISKVRGIKDGYVYLLTVNRCTGRIVDRDRLRPA